MTDERHVDGDGAEVERVAYDHFVSAQMLRNILEPYGDCKGTMLAVEHHDGWGRAELRAATGLGLIEGDDGSRYLVVYTMADRDE